MNPLKIIKYIRQNKLTKSEFCKMCNISATTLDSIIYYGKSVDFSVVEKISATIGIGVYELYMHNSTNYFTI